ncbi:IS21 family transposase [Lacicoccus alkaliphilus]|uniref:Integrase core domain-containing protein n=1 Tax=Lacicoccus alkaliphilus DSM 16010 TaxID=1123231 RepID=A0A1M7D134_9BACL|nr:IS21 family transposase [Salinicoccus alkaliphilus]SHL73180.1 Integrase core domain-containing protein [Salinicoccus alkaliphilus DSM 16010]
MPNYLEIVRLTELSFSQRKISDMVGSGRPVIKRTIDTAKQHKLTYKELSGWEADRIDTFFGPKPSTSSQREMHYTMPDYAALSKSLAQPGVTMQLLWEEYVDVCRHNHQPYYRLTQFKKHFNDYLSKQSFTHVMKHKAGERVEVDWAGSKIRWIDPDTGEIIDGYLFVAVLPFSGYGFALGCYDMKQPSWIDAHIQMFEYFQGVPIVTVPDNLKTGITKHTRTMLKINKTYESMANHYHTIILPTRVRKPKDKPSVENTVKSLTTHIIARMRNYQCFGLDDYNDYLRKELDRFNQKPFQKKPGSRFSMFNDMERGALHPLPTMPFEYCEYKTIKVYNNAHISYQKHHYSVPYQYIGQSLKLKIYARKIQVWDQDRMLCEHGTLSKMPGGYTTAAEHLPENSATHGQWNSQRYLKWARHIGPNVHLVVETMFSDGPEQRHYKRVHALLKLADTHSDSALNDACQHALERSATPGYRLIKQLLNTGTSHLKSSTPESPEQSFLRGAGYYEQ